MKRKIRYILSAFLPVLPGLLSLVSCTSPSFVEATGTPGPKARAALELAAQAGKTDGIVVLGILIFVFIAVPIILRYRQMKALE